MYKLKLKKALSYSGIVSAGENNPFVEVETEGIADDAVATGYFDIVERPEIEQDETDNEVVDYTAASLKKLNAEQQKVILDALAFKLNNNEEANNEDERIALILKLQEEQKAEEE